MVKILNIYEREFIKKNKKYWGNSLKTKTHQRDSVILVEGFLGSDPNYLIRTGIAAKAVEESAGGTIKVVLRGNNERVKSLYRSFGITKFIGIEQVKVPLYKRILYVLYTIFICIGNSREKILNISYDKMKIGHLLYDDILHDDISNTESINMYTIEKINWSCIYHIYNFFRSIYIYDKIISQNQIIAYVTTHTVYCELGILPCLCEKKGIKVIYTDDKSVELINNEKGLYAHERINASIKNIIKKSSEQELIQIAEKDLENRMQGNGDIDSIFAYKDKKRYTRKEFKSELGISNCNPIIIIFAHVFRDAPHLASRMIHYDYYDWLIDTLKCANNVTNVNWVLKKHPSAEQIYNENDKVEDILDKNNLHNILVCPSNFNTNSILEVADVIVTCQGTIGIESSCQGIPAIICGKAFYANFGFTIEPSTRKEYHRRLKEIARIKKLNQQQIKQAKIVYGAFNKCFSSELSVLNSEVLDYIWGYTKKRNIKEAYRLIVESYEKQEYRKTYLYRKVYNYFDKIK